MRRPAASVLLLLAACGSPARPAGGFLQPGAPLLSAEGELLEERWYAVRLEGSKLGHVHETRRRVDGLLRTESLSQVWIQAWAPAPTFVDYALFEETPEGTPVRFKIRTRSPAGDVDRDVRVEPSEGPDLLFPAALERRMRIRTPGAEVSYRVISSGTGLPMRLTARAEADEGELMRFTLASEPFPAGRFSEWRDRDGRLVKSDTDIGLKISQQLSSREEAIWLEGRYLAYRGRLGEPRNVRRAVYRITLKQGVFDPAGFTFDGQTVEGRTIRVEPFRPDAPSDERGAPEEEDPSVVAAAREAVGDERNAWKAAQAIERWVHRKLRKTSAVLPTAKEILERGEGDCTEHAELAAAMARAAGIQARTVTGLTAVGPIFGEHAWTEVWIGRWVGIDAAMGGPFFDATHLRTGPDVNIRDLEIEVVEADP